MKDKKFYHFLIVFPFVYLAAVTNIGFQVYAETMPFACRENLRAIVGFTVFAFAVYYFAMISHFVRTMEKEERRPWIWKTIAIIALICATQLILRFAKLS